MSQSCLRLRMTEGRPFDWMNQAACLGANPELFFPDRGENLDAEEARQICRGCSFREDCLEYALANHERFGVWGGMSERDRRRLRRRRILQARPAASTE